MPYEFQCEYCGRWSEGKPVKCQGEEFCSEECARKWLKKENDGPDNYLW